MIQTPALNATNNVNWNSNTEIKDEVLIKSNQVVTVAPNTKIKVAPGSKITVLGKLYAKGGLTLEGKSWTGLYIKVDVNINRLSLSGANTPFVEKNGTLTINGGKSIT